MPLANLPLLDWTLFGGKEMLAGLVLLVLLLLLLTGPTRRKIRLVLIYLMLNYALLGLRQVLTEENAIRSMLESLALFLLVTAQGLGVFLLLTHSTLSRAFISPLPHIFIYILHSLVYVLA